MIPGQKHQSMEMREPKKIDSVEFFETRPNGDDPLLFKTNARGPTSRLLKACAHHVQGAEL